MMFKPYALITPEYSHGEGGFGGLVLPKGEVDGCLLLLGVEEDGLEDTPQGQEVCLLTYFELFRARSSAPAVIRRVKELLMQYAICNLFVDTTLWGESILREAACEHVYLEGVSLKDAAVKNRSYSKLKFMAQQERLRMPKGQPALAEQLKNIGEDPLTGEAVYRDPTRAAHLVEALLLATLATESNNQKGSRWWYADAPETTQEGVPGRLPCGRTETEPQPRKPSVRLELPRLKRITNHGKLEIYTGESRSSAVRRWTLDHGLADTGFDDTGYDTSLGAADVF